MSLATGRAWRLHGAKLIHLLVFVATVALGKALIRAVPDLTKDDPTTFSTLTGVATLYGVVFAIIEVWRAKSAAQLAAVRAKQAADQVHAAYGLRDASECQSCIQYALGSIDEHGFAPLSVLSRIVKLYASEFAEDYDDAKSDVRKRVAMVESYASLHRSTRPASPKKVQTTLMAMTAHLSASIGKRTKVEEAG